MKALKFLLFPFIPVYAAAMWIRNMFFDKNVFKSEQVSAKIISVGNITLGGSGKTPLVIYLLNFLKLNGINAGVLSRGYGRKSKGYKLVSDGKNILCTVERCGDEIIQTAETCKVPAAVSEDRVEGSEKLIEDTGVSHVVLDDAFQHRWIERDLNLVIIDQRFLINKSIFVSSLLPGGEMRESFSSLKRADVVIINKKFSDQKEIPVKRAKLLEKKKVFYAHYMAESFVDVVRKEVYPIDEFEGQHSLIVSGVANPFSFLNALKQCGVNTDNQIIFRDHKNYSIDEVQKIRREFYSTNSHSVVTTEKDAVKLINFAREFDDIDIFYLKIKIVFDDEVGFNDFILNNIT